MLTVNIDIQDGLINCQTGIITHIEFDLDSNCKVYVKYSDEQAGFKEMRSSYLGRQMSWQAGSKEMRSSYLGRQKS